MTDVPFAHSHHSNTPSAPRASRSITMDLFLCGARVCRSGIPAAVFWMSGETKVDGWHLKDNAIALFESE